ncbi:MAG TPA: N-carbamoylsarcosine amidohydrolase [Blastocatellia bacterium]
MGEDVQSFYRQRGFSNRVGFGSSPALLIIDFIRAFTDPSSPLSSNLDREVEATARLLEAARKKGAAIFFTTVAYDKGFADAGVFIKKVPSLRVLEAGSPMVEIDERLSPREREHVLVKKYASAFFGTTLASTLVSNRIDTIIIAGCTTSGCVRATAVDGCQHGFRTMVVREAVGDRAEGPHAANLFDIDAKYGDVVSLDETLNYLRSVAADNSAQD